MCMKHFKETWQDVTNLFQAPETEESFKCNNLISLIVVNYANYLYRILIKAWPS